MFVLLTSDKRLLGCASMSSTAASATAFGELVHSENLRLAPRDESGRAALNGATPAGGNIPINVSGAWIQGPSARRDRIGAGA